MAKVQVTNIFLVCNFAFSDKESFGDNRNWENYFPEPAKQNDLFHYSSNSSINSGDKNNHFETLKASKSTHS